MRNLMQNEKCKVQNEKDSRKPLANSRWHRGNIFIGVLLVFSGISLSGQVSWWTTTVDSAQNTGIYGTSIVVDSLNIPHIAYVNANAQKLIYTSFNPTDSTWSYDTVPAGYEPSLVLDSLGYPHIATWQTTPGGYAWKDSSGWHTSDPGYTMTSPSLALDKNDYPHIGCAMGILDTMVAVVYTYWDGAVWHLEIVDTMYYANVGDISMARDDNGCIHMAYGYLPSGQPQPNDLRPGIGYAVRDTNEIWHKEEVVDVSDSACEFDLQPSIALDSLNQPHISYESNDTLAVGRLKYAVKRDGVWYIRTIDASGSASANDYGVGSWSCLALDRFDNPHISYRGNGWLKYAWKSFGKWHIEKIDSIESDGMQVSCTGLAIDRNDYSHISYDREIPFNWANMKYATGYVESGIWVDGKREYNRGFSVYPGITSRELRIRYVLEKDEEVDIGIYNILGQRVETITKGKREKGENEYIWRIGRDISSGIYFCVLKGDGLFLVKKFIIIR